MYTQNLTEDQLHLNDFLLEQFRSSIDKGFTDQNLSNSDLDPYFRRLDIIF